MFKGFLIVMLLFSSVSFGYFIGGKIITLWEKYKNKIKIPKKIKLSDEEIKEKNTNDLEGILLEQFKKLTVDLLIKQCKAIKIKSEATKSLESNSKEAIYCKDMFKKTNNKKFYEKSLIFCSEINTSKSILESAIDNINMYQEQIDTADIELRAVCSKINNKKLEYNLLNSGDNNAVTNNALTTFDLNSILEEYKEKIEIKRLDADVEKTLARQNALPGQSINLNDIPKEIQLVYETL